MTDSTKRPLKVFLCHASADKPAVRKLFRYLRSKGMDPWLDEFKLLPGQRWEAEIPKALYASDAIIVILSKNSITNEGYVQREIKYALDKALDMPEGRIFLIPARIEACELPESLKGYQWVDLFQKNWNRRLMSSLNERIVQLGLTLLSTTGETQPPVTTVQDGLSISTFETVSSEIEGALSTDQSKFREISKKKETIELPLETSAEEHKVEKKIEEPVRISPLSRREKRDSDVFQRSIPEKKKIVLNPKVRQFIALFAGLFLTTLCLRGGGNYLSNALFDRLVTITPTPTNPFNITPTSGSAPTNTPSPTERSTPATPVIGIGSSIISDKDGMTLRYVPAGEFTMGSNNGDSDEQPVHQVYLDAFWIDKTEVTNSMYAACVDAGICERPASYRSLTRDDYYGNSNYDEHPVIYVSWNKAKTYCEWADRRLPTEAEWEKAARGENAFEYPWGNEFDDKRANFCDKNCPLGWRDGVYDDGYADTTPVGTYPSGVSPYGALDMAGNVWEWVQDMYSATYYSRSLASNPLGPDSGEYRVLRGGSWKYHAISTRSALRGGYPSSYSNEDVGFRCAMDATP